MSDTPKHRLKDTSKLRYKKLLHSDSSLFVPIEQLQHIQKPQMFDADWTPSIQGDALVLKSQQQVDFEQKKKILDNEIKIAQEHDAKMLKVIKIVAVSVFVFLIVVVTIFACKK